MSPASGEAIESEEEQNARALATVAERSVRSPNNALLGWQVLNVDVAAETVYGEFDGRQEFVNAAGVIGGGFIAAMLDTALSSVLFTSDHPHMTASLNVDFVGSAAVGPIRSRSRIVREGRTLAFVEGELRTPDGDLIATATAVARFINVDWPAPSAAGA